MKFCHVGGGSLVVGLGNIHGVIYVVSLRHANAAIKFDC